MSNYLKNFTKKSSITKALQLELIPQGNTAKTIQEKNFEGFDSDIKDLTTELSPYVDAYIKDLSNKTLKAVNIDFEALKAAEEKAKEEKDKENKKKNSKTKENKKKDEKTDSKLIITKTILSVLKDSVKDTLGNINNINSKEFIQTHLPAFIAEIDISKEEKEYAQNLIDEIDGKTDVIRPFFITRITALTNWMPKRVLENYEKYLSNISIYEKLLNSDLKDTILQQWPEVEKYVKLGYYTNILSQPDIDAYNKVISGIVTQDKMEKKGIQVLVKEYNDANPDHTLPRPKPLYKQILMPKEKAFSIQTITADDEAMDTIEQAKQENSPAAGNLLALLDSARASDIVVEYNNLHVVSHIVFEDHNIIPDAVHEHAFRELEKAEEEAKTARERKAIQKEMDALGKTLKKSRYTMNELENILYRNIYTPFVKAAKRTVSYARTAETGFSLDGSIRENEKVVLATKSMFDAWTDVRNIVRSIRRKDTDYGNNAFYEKLDEINSSMKVMHKAQQLIVSYVTRKPGDIAEKTQAVMGTARRTASKWLLPDGKMTIANHTILQRDGKYYFYILSPGTKPVNILGESESKVFVQKKGQNSLQMLPKVAFSKAREFFKKNPDEQVYFLKENMTRPIQITRELFHIKEENLYTTGALKKGLVTQEEYKRNLTAMLSMYKELIEAYNEYAYFDIKLRPIEEYEESGSFFADINAQNKYHTWKSCNIELMDKLVESGDALCFLIHNRNMYTKKEKKTSYAKVLLLALEDETCDILLNSVPKIFRRKASVNRNITHKAGSILVNKKDKNGNTIQPNVYVELYRYYNDMLNTTDLSSVAQDYIRSGTVITSKARTDIIKDKRYTEDKWFIAFSYTKNMSVIPQKTSLKKDVDAVKENMNILAITRSEQDLLYYAITKPNGEKIESGSLNVIHGTDYWTELQKIDELRKEEKSEKWKYDRKVKDLRNGYLSHAISVIVKKVVEYDAIIVLEYIPDDAKNKWSALDNTTFKTFEGKLTARLSDLCFSDVKDGEPGSISNPYQLCENTDNGYQNGIVHYIYPSYTGNADLKTGFVNVFDTDNIASISAKRMFLSKFDDIHFDEKKHRFLFTFDYDKFKTRALPHKTKWTVEAGGAAVIYNREHKYNEYFEERASLLVDLIEECGHDPKSNLVPLALDGRMKGNEADVLFRTFMSAVGGALRAHDNERKKYISPINGREVDYAENATMNLIRKWLWSQKDDAGEWVDNIVAA